MRGAIATDGSTARLAPVHAVKGAVRCPRIGQERVSVPVGIAGRTFPRCRGANAATIGSMGLAGSAAAPEVIDVKEDGEDVQWGRDFSERFSIGDVIGEGQQGLVRKVVNRNTGEMHAVKVLSRQAAAGTLSAVGERRLRSEARFLMRLQSCPAVARMFGAYEDEEHIYIVMERLEAGSIADMLKKIGRLTEDEAGQLMRAVLGFLVHSHDRGIYYGDVKPANFMLGNAPCQGCAHRCTTGRLRGLAVKAIDFGTCQQKVPGVYFRKRSGSPMYMAPEVFLGRYGVEADLWAAGVMLFQLLSGRLPFAEYDSSGELVGAGLHLGFSFDGELWDGVSPGARDLITRMLVRNPAKRISAKEALNHAWFDNACEPMETRNLQWETSSIVAVPEDLPVAIHAHRL